MERMVKCIFGSCLVSFGTAYTLWSNLFCLPKTFSVLFGEIAIPNCLERIFTFRDPCRPCRAACRCYWLKS